MKDQILLVVHQQSSDPGRVARQLRSRGYGLDIRTPSGGDDLPETMEDHAGAIMFGGPMSANDDHLDFVRREIDWLSVVLQSGKPFLGICLGAQMLVRNLGGKVELHPEERVEIGYHPITPTENGKSIFPEPMCVYQWHKEGFDSPGGVERLATGPVFENQAFRYGNAYGIQFHPEVTTGIMLRWLTAAAHMLESEGAQGHADQVRARRRHDSATIRWLSDFLDIWLASGAATPCRPSSTASETLRQSAP